MTENRIKEENGKAKEQACTGKLILPYCIQTQCFPPFLCNFRWFYCNAKRTNGRTGGRTDKGADKEGTHLNKGLFKKSVF